MPKSTTIGDVQFERFIQSSFRIKSGDTVVYIDPHRISQGEKADLILVTHEHFDHLDTESIKALEKDDTVIVVNAACAGNLQGKVKGKVVSVQEGQTASQKGVDIRAVPGYNNIHPRGFNVGFVFNLGGQAIYHAGDTGHVPEMASLGSIDVALLPIGGTYTMDEREAAEAVKAIKPKVAIPMHYGYATGGDPQKFASQVGAAAQVVVLD
ncbi:MAG: MBL fold metallo-hydrolase [Chloroflexota bacterium]|nr:MBL fold metallo-hydrolase [Chloroflexota bacterium]